MKSYSITSQPAIEPVTLLEVKGFLKITTSDEDAYLTSLITATRQQIEQYLGRALITQTINLKLDCIKSRNPLWFAPVQSITHVKIYDAENVASTILNTYYTLINSDLIFNSSFSVSDYFLRENYPIEIQYVAGYGANASDVPAAIRQGLLEQIGNIYSCGESEMSTKAKILLESYIYRAYWTD